MAVKPSIIKIDNGYLAIEHPHLPEVPLTTIDADASAGVTAIIVGTTDGITNGDYLLAGLEGEAGTEPLKVNGAVVPGTSLTITASKFYHPAGTPLRKLAWKQVQIAHAATVGGAKTTQTAVDIAWTQKYTETAEAASDNFWFARYVDYAGTGYSSYTDPVPAAGYEPDTIRGVINGALAKGDYKIDGDKVTDYFLRQQVTNCELNVYARRRRWPQFDMNDVVLGTLDPGVTRFDMPDNISDPDTTESIRTIRVRGVPNLRYIDQEQYDGIRWDLAVSPLAAPTAIGGVTITLDSVVDFDDAPGSAMVGSDSISYTGIDPTLNQLTGVTGLTAIWPIDLEVFQGPDVNAVPTVYTIKDRQIVLPLPAAADYQDRAIIMNHYGKPVFPTLDTDIINFADPEMYHWYIAWQIELIKHNGTETDEAKAHKANFEGRAVLLMRKTRLQDYSKLVPRREVSRQKSSEVTGEDIIDWKLR
jgi:hypothetical protein